MSDQTKDKKPGFFYSLGNIVTGSASLISERIDEMLTKSYSSRPQYQHQPLRLAVSHNPEEDSMAGNFLERPSTITFSAMRKMAERDVIIASIITRRSNQVSSFARPSESKYDSGFVIKMRDEKAESSPQIEEIKKQLVRFIMNTGRSTDDRPKDTDLSYERFIRLMVHDVLAFDCISVEKIHDQEGSLVCFLPVAADTIRYAYNPDKTKIEETITPYASTDEEKARLKQMKDQHKDTPEDELCYVQVFRGRPVGVFTKEDLHYESYTPTNNVGTPYSVTPLEKLVNIVSSHLFAEAHNRLFFSQTGSTRGMLFLKGEIPPHHLEGFRRQWYSQVTGAKNSWRMPILAGVEDVQFLSMQPNNRDMEYNEWMHYLVKVMCAMFSIAPAEIGWETQAQTPMFDSSGAKVESMLKHGRDTGLRPILRFIEDFMNEIIIRAFDEDAYKIFEFQFVGLDVDSIDIEVERCIKQLNYKSLNEVRASQDLPPVNHPAADIPLNPTLLQLVMAPQPGEGEPEDEEGGDPENEAKEEAPEEDPNAEKSLVKIEYYDLKKGD